MNEKLTRAETRRGKRIFRAARDRQRGYSIVGKQLFVAYLIEAAIIGSGAAAGYQFANRYAGDAAPTQVASLTDWIGPWVEASSNNGWWMAIIATIGICVAELARLPLAQAVRTNRSWGMKLLATIGVIMMCIVTTKTMSQVMEQMFHPRLRYVYEATLAANEAEMKLATLAADRKVAVAAFDPLDASVKAIDKRIDTLGASLAQQGAKPPQREEKTFHRNKKGKKWTTSVFKDVPWAGDNLQERIDAASAERAEAVAQRNAAAARLAEIDRQIVEADAVVTKRAGAKTKAVSESQLHSFTAMVFGKDPVEVTDAEVFWFLRFFVFIPAIMIAVASTLLVLTAYRPVPKGKRTESLSLDLQMVPSLRKHLATTGVAA